MGNTLQAKRRALCSILFSVLFTIQGLTKLVAQPQGSLNGLFSVGASKKVFFSQGNLQYQASTNTFRFAPLQTESIGEDNSNISSTYSGWIDLFGWGTSGYNHGATSYQPWSSSTNNSYYYAYGNSCYNLYDQNGKADWGLMLFQMEVMRKTNGAL